MNIDVMTAPVKQYTSYGDYVVTVLKQYTNLALFYFHW